MSAIYENFRAFSVRQLWLALVLLVGTTATSSAVSEQTFAVLQIGSRTYQNVTVTTKAKDYIFILHSAGMNNIKVADLSPELRQELGYSEPAEANKAKAATTATTTWAKQTAAKIESPQIKQFEAEATEFARTAFSPRMMIFSLLSIGILHLFFSLCFKIICDKTGNAPGPLIWLPILQILPLFRAAGMSPGWILIAPIAMIPWSFKIAAARQKSAIVGAALLFPGVSLLALLYLAFSAAGSEERKTPIRRIERPELMSLETA